VQALLEPYAAVSAGTFGRVLECWDRKHRSYVAIKIVRNVKKYRDAAMIEVSLPFLFDPLSAHYICICSFFGARLVLTCTPCQLAEIGQAL